MISRATTAFPSRFVLLLLFGYLVLLSSNYSLLGELELSPSPVELEPQQHEYETFNYQCDNEKVFVNNPIIPSDAGTLRETTFLAPFEALPPVLPNEMPETRGWDNEAFDAVNEFFWGMEGGIVLELGGLDGQRYSISNDFLPFHWHRILMEASPRYNRHGKERSPDSTYVAAAVCNKGSVHYLLSNDASSGAINGIAEFMTPSFIQQFHKKAYVASKKATNWNAVRNWEAWSQQQTDGSAVVTIPCLTLSKVFSCLQTPHINLFVLDVEGGELSVLGSIDFDYVQFDVVVVETDPQYRPSGFRDQVTAFLRKQGYVKEFDRGRNSWFRHQNFAKLSKQ